ncbi:cystathionine beta-lyase [Streptococcus phocae subsp. phocae]
MTDYIQLAMTYGGFTSLDKVYLTNRLKELTEAQKLAFITPPPSVINAYFAEIYQKQSPAAATDYYYDLSRALQLTPEVPSFDEEKPFVRLNLLGASYGFVYDKDDEVAIVFSEKPEAISSELLFELARIFPHYVVYLDNKVIKMAKPQFDDASLTDITPEGVLLSKVYRLSDDVTLLKGFNTEELLALRQDFSGQCYYSFAQREFKIYITH